MSSVFDWKGEAAKVVVPDFSAHRHAKGRQLSNIAAGGWESTCVEQFDLHGKSLRKYPSIASAARDLGLAAGEIGRCLRGQRDQVGGYRFALGKRMGDVL